MKFHTLWVLAIVDVFSQSGAIIIRISNGLIRGRQLLDFDNNPFFAFTSIPFAQPPIGKLRFQPPKQVNNWKCIKNCTVEVPACHQPVGSSNIALSRGTEDCLYLNVYTNSLGYHTKKQPVLVYIHGGGFAVLSSHREEFAPDFLITENIVIVTTNYRLGALGFLTLNHENLISANNGFKDQVMVFQWIQKNIGFFGGDPDSVTLSGESAGAIASHLHIFSPLSRGLFHRIIARSGSGFQPLARVPSDTAVILAKEMGLPTTNFTEMFLKLQSASVEDIYQAQARLNWFDFYLNRPMPFGLNIENEGPCSFMTEDPVDLYNRGDFEQVPMMISTTNMEGYLFKADVMFNLDDLDNVSIHIPMSFGENSTIIEKFVYEYYFSSEINNFEYPLLEFSGDVWFKQPVYNTGLLHGSYQPVYMYYFQLDTMLNIFKRVQPVLINLAGASHVDDDSYLLFKVKKTPVIDPNSIEDLWWRRMVRMQANFVKYSNPTPIKDSLLDDIIWPTFNKETRTVLNLVNSNLSVLSFYSNNFDFWDALYSTYSRN